MTSTPAHDRQTLSFYEREAAAYASRPRRAENPDLTAFLARLPSHAHVLDLGCGGGQDGFDVKQAGFRLTAMDGSPALAAEAEARLGQAVRVQLFEQLEDVGAFDAIWANASLLHVPKVALPAIFIRIHRALMPCGAFYASFKSGGNEGRDGLGRYYNYPSKDELIAALPGPDWMGVELEHRQGRGYDGVVTGWLSVIAVKSGP